MLLVVPSTGAVTWIHDRDRHERQRRSDVGTRTGWKAVPVGGTQWRELFHEVVETNLRTARGETGMREMIEAGIVETRPAESDPVAMRLLERLSTKSRDRWPADSLAPQLRSPGLLPVLGQEAAT